MEHKIHIPAEELEYSFFRSSGPGGQKKNTTDSSVRLRHLPTGIVVVATESRSQFRNKALALQELQRRLAARRHRPKKRVATHPSRAAQKRRLDAKRQRGAIKNLRRSPDMDD